MWKFDTNPKESLYLVGSRGTRNYRVATPIFYDGYIYIGNGQSPEHGEGIGHLYCIDPTKRGDVSPALAVDAQGQPLAPRTIRAVDVKQGEKAIPNPNSAVVWHYSAAPPDGKGQPKFESTFHRSVGSVAIANDLLFVADFSGVLHCLDAKKSVNGQPVVHWTHDLLAACWSTPLIADGKVFIGDEDGDVAIFKLSSQKTMLAEHNLGKPIYSTPAFANNTLFLATRNRLLAIADPTVIAAAKSASPVGLDFLKPYPKLHGLSLDMTEPKFLEIVKQQELKTRKTVEGEKVTHQIALGDDHTLIVMFDKDAKCSGLQRVLGDDTPPIDPMKELASFQGTWCWDFSQPWTWPQPIGVGTDSDGRKSEKRCVIDGNRITWVGPDGERIYVTFTIDPFNPLPEQP